MRKITIQTHFGIGDALFLTPTLQRIKQAYPEAYIEVNTRWRILFENNPHIDRLGNAMRGTRLMYCDPVSCTGKPGRRPTCHNIEADWRIICNDYGLQLQPPELKPQLFFEFPRHAGGGPIGVQVITKDLYYAKKNWPHAVALSQQSGFWPIPLCRDLRELAEHLTSCRAVVCIEGGISHLCRALDVPCVVVYGGFSDPAWNGYEEQTNVINFLDCSPCFSNEPCVKGSRPCMTEISVEHVAAIAQEIAERSWMT